MRDFRRSPDPGTRGSAAGGVGSGNASRPGPGQAYPLSKRMQVVQAVCSSTA